MRILQFINSLSSGGAERFVVDLCNELYYRGNTVALVVFGIDSPKLQFNKQFLNENIELYSLNVPQKFDSRIFYRILKVIHTFKPDIVHGHMNVMPYLIIPSLLYKKIKFFNTLHNLAERCIPQSQRLLLRIFYKKNLIRPITISKQCCESFVEFFNLETPQNIDNGRSPVLPTADYNRVRDEVISYFPEGRSVPIFLHVARFHPQKNQQVLIEAFNKLEKIRPNSSILLVIGAKFDCEEAQRLKMIASKNIYFLGEKNNVGDYMLNSDFFCLSSIYEGLPISLLEALSCGITPIVTPVGGIIDVVEDRITGYVSKSTSTEDYLEAMLSALEKPLNSDTIKKCFLEKYSMSICCEKHINCYLKR